MRLISKNKVEPEIKKTTSYPPIYDSSSFFQKKGSQSSGDSDNSVDEKEGFYFYFKQLVLFLNNQQCQLSFTEF